jgi:hypothetical protein
VSISTMLWTATAACSPEPLGVDNLTVAQRL